MARRRWNIETIKQVLDGENPFIQTGFIKKQEKKRKIGEEWTDSKGKTWRKTDGGKVSVNKQMDSIRELVQSKCSVCGFRIDWGNKLDKKIFSKTGKCFDCLQEEEMVLRVDQHKWESYQKIKIMNNKLGALKDFKEKVVESIDFLKNDTGVMGDVLSTGEIITFTGKSNPQWLIDAEADLIKVNEEIKRMEKEILELDKSK